VLSVIFKSMLGPITLLLLCAAPAFCAGSAADLARTIREAGFDPAQCYRVRDLSLYREDLKLYFTDGYLIFGKPVAGERLAVAFSGDMEGGDGEVLLLPPNPAERRSLAKFTQSPNLDEHFRAAMLVFTDATAAELLTQIRDEGRGRMAPEMGPLLSEQWSPVAGNITGEFGPRLVQDLLSPTRETGFFFAAIAGKHLGNFDLLFEPRGSEQIMAAQLVQHGTQLAYDIWTTFPSRSARTGKSKPPGREFSTSHFQIETSLDQDLRMKAATHITINIGDRPQRVFAFAISKAIQVTSARIDGFPVELLSNPAERGAVPRADENNVFLVVAPGALPAGTRHEIEFEQEGSVISSPGNGVYFVGARSNWYPHAGDTFATYDLTFRYPKRLTLAATGEQIEDHIDGEWRITRRRIDVGVRLAGFNLGEYERVTSETDGVSIEVYGNRHLEPALAGRPQVPLVIPPRGGRGSRSPASAVLTAPGPPDPLARLHLVAADITASYQFFTGLFGPSPVKHLTVSPIPGAFGQGFPGLIYISTAAFLDPTERPPELRGAAQQVFFSDLMQAHEVAHQWWGNVVVGAGYQDEWLMESLANYSSLLWLEKKKGTKAMEASLEGFRDDLTRIGSNGMPVESAGPVTWGFRLESASQADAWRAITYEKGAWILHMLRRRLGDERFLKMLAETCRRFEHTPLTTANFQALVQEYRPPRVPSSSIDSFFDTWVYSTGVPTLALHTSIRTTMLTGTVEQSGVDQDFSAEVPVEIQFAKGPPEIVWVETSNEPAPFSVTLKQIPLRVTIPAGTGVLALKK
jgi:hypothetical protein